MLEDLPRQFLIALILPMIFLVLQLLAPNKTKEKTQNFRALTKEEIKKYNRYEAFSLLFMAVIIMSISYLFYIIGELAYKDIYSDIQQVIILPSPYIFSFVGLFFGFGLLPYCLTPIYKNLLRDEYDLFNNYLGTKHNLNGDKIWKFITVTFLTSGSVFFYLCLNYSVAFNPQGRTLTINNFFSLNPIEKSVDEIKGFTVYSHSLTQKGDLMAHPHFIIRFSNGETWNSDNLTSEDNIDSVKKFISLLQKELHFPIQYKTSPE